MAHAIVLCLCALALLGVMPFTFFRRGRVTAGWLLTAAPFFLDAAVLLGGLAGVVQPLALPVGAGSALSYAAVPGAAAAIALIAMTIGVHRAPVSLWHQPDDQPRQLVTAGPYAYVRHPFYTAFIVMLLSCAAAFPHAATIALALLGTLQLNRTAAREERRLLASALCREYAAYMGVTRRFLPLRRAPRQHGSGVATSRSRAGARSRSARPASIRRAS